MQAALAGQDNALEIYNQAQQAHEKGDLTKAIMLYKEVIKLLPENFEPKYQCAAACLSLDSAESNREALALMKQVVESKPDFARGHFALGVAALRVGEPAETSLRKALELDPSISAARLPLAEIVIAKKSYKEAEQLLAPLFSQDLLDREGLLLLALAQHKQGKLKESIESYNRVLAKGRDAEALFQRGQIYLSQKNYSAAVADLRLAYEASGEVETGLLLAEAHTQNGEKEKASELAKVLLEKSSDQQLRAKIADLLADVNREDATKAAEELEKLLASDPKNISYLVRLGEIYNSSSPEKAVEYWQKAMSISPKLDYRIGLASALLKSQRFDDAISEFGLVLAQDSESYEAHAGLALAYFKKEFFPPSAQHFIWMVNKKPEIVINFYFLAICFDRMDDYAQALKAYEIFLKVADPRIHQLEIEKVNLRMPSLKRQLERTKKR
ncbi:MAG: tetratricopeptide repeat protein [Blastocatellia bacterium]|nr:tetratricopeptide repeat protein [Blastocatellia bacterium]